MANTGLVTRLLLCKKRQFHKYWNNPDLESLKDYLNIRDKLNVPIFMGEGGENNLQWYYSVFKLYDQMKNIIENIEFLQYVPHY